MDELKVIIHNAKTGEIIEREMTEAELLQAEKDAERQLIRLAEGQAQANAKAAAEAKLEALGLTAEDLKALGLA